MQKPVFFYFFGDILEKYLLLPKQLDFRCCFGNLRGSYVKDKVKKPEGPPTRTSKLLFFFILVHFGADISNWFILVLKFQIGQDLPLIVNVVICIGTS